MVVGRAMMHVHGVLHAEVSGLTGLVPAGGNADWRDHHIRAVAGTERVYIRLTPTARGSLMIRAYASDARGYLNQIANRLAPASSPTHHTLLGMSSIGIKNSDFGLQYAGHPVPGTVEENEGDAPLLLRQIQLPQSGLTLRNRSIVPPLCMYSGRDGFISPWQLVHLGSFGIHGVGAIVVEATAVEARGRISPQDLGLWKDEHIEGHAGLVRTLKQLSPSVQVGIQLAHAGRKASTWAPTWQGSKQNAEFVTRAEGGWDDDVIAPSALKYNDGWIEPKALTTEQVGEVKDAWLKAADRAFAAGYDFVEIHSAHGYLLSSFLSPISNKRTDQYGGDYENRTRLLREIVEAVHSKYPEKSLWVRVNGTDYAEHLNEPSWTSEDSAALAPILADAGVEVFDVSAGGLTPLQKISVYSFVAGPGYQAYLAEAATKKVAETGKSGKILVGSVGLLEGGAFPGDVAEKVLEQNQAQLIFVGRGLMKDPAWLEHAALALSQNKVRVNGVAEYEYVFKKLDERAARHAATQKL